MKMKIVSISIVIFFGSIIPLSYVHELGHGYVCMMEGYDFDIQLGLDGGRMVCYGEVENQILFRGAGGVLAGIAALIPLRLSDGCLLSAILAWYEVIKFLLNLLLFV